MRKLGWSLAIIAIVLLAAFNTIMLLGWKLPESHVVKRSMVLKRAPADVWNAVSDFSHETDWRTDLKSVERLPDQNGEPVWRENYKHMGPETLATAMTVPGVYMVRTITNPSGMMAGSWEYSVQPWGKDTKVTITEHGDIRNPFWRYLSAKIFKYRWIDDYLRMLAAKFHEPAKITSS